MLSVCQLHLNKTGRKKVIIFTFFEKFPFFFGCTACRIFVPHPGIKLLPPVVKVQNLNHCTAREVPENYPLTRLIWGENYRVRDGQWHTILENFSIYSLAFHFIFKNFVYLLTFAVLGLCRLEGFSLAVVSRGYSLVVTCRILIAVTSLVVGHGLQGVWASAVVTPGL